MFPLLITIKILPCVCPPVTGEDELSTYDHVLEIGLGCTVTDTEGPETAGTLKYDVDIENIPDAVNTTGNDIPEAPSWVVKVGVLTVAPADGLNENEK